MKKEIVRGYRKKFTMLGLSVLPALMLIFVSCKSNLSKIESGRYGNWRSSKIGGGGYLLNTFISPIDNKIMYTHSDVAGIYRSEDSGNSWMMIHGTAKAPLRCVRSISVDPCNSDILLAAVGNQWEDKQGVFRSNNGGKSWEKVLSAQFFGNGNQRAKGPIFARSTKNPDILFCASSRDGVFKSLDNGKTWINKGLPGLMISNISIDRTDDKKIWVTAASVKMYNKNQKKYQNLKGGFFFSVNGGKDWNKLSERGPDEMLQSPMNPKLFYGIFNSSYVAITEDNGRHWKKFSNGLELSNDTSKRSAPQSANYYIAIGSGPDFILLASGGGTFYRLKCGTDKWEKLPNPIVNQGNWYGRREPGKWDKFSRATASITVDPKNSKHWILTDWYALYQTFDSGKTWNLTIDGIENTVIHNVQQTVK